MRAVGKPLVRKKPNDGMRPVDCAHSRFGPRGNDTRRVVFGMGAILTKVPSTRRVIVGRARCYCDSKSRM